MALRIWGVPLIGVMIFLSPWAHASKIEHIQKVLRDECRLNVSNKKAMTLLRPLYLTCVPGTKVIVGKCDISCLKNTGKLLISHQDVKKEDSL